MKKKFILFATTIGTLSLPIGAAIACSSSTEDNEKILTIQVEKEWLTNHQKIIDEFKTTYSDDMNKQNISDIKIVTGGSFENEKILLDKGMRDESLADVFMFKADKITNFINYLRPFSKNSWDSWKEAQKTYLGTEATLNSQATTSLNVAIKGSALYGVPQNIEAMVEIYKQGITPTQVITEFANLWMAVGYFNTVNQDMQEIYNMKGIVETDENGKIVNHFAEQRTQIKAGFKRVLEAINKLTPKIKDVTSFSTKSDDAKATITKYFTTNVETTGILTGPWDIKDGQYLKTEIKAVKPTNWNQWGGSWLYTINKRVTQEEATIAEKLIAYLLNPNNAVAIYNGASKISPLNEGIEIIENSADITTSQKQIVQAISETPTLLQPTDPAFEGANIWGNYASTINSIKTDLISDFSAKIDDLSEQLTKYFEDSINSTIALNNK